MKKFIVYIFLIILLGGCSGQNAKEVGFKDKVWLVIGDSISEHYRTDKNYSEYISEWLGIKVENVAKVGTGYITPFRGSKSWLDSIDTYPQKVDFITVMGALNDREQPVGNIDDKDVSTLYGGLNAFYQKLKEKYPGIPIGVITSTPRDYCHGEDGQYVGHVNAVIKVAEKYSLPVLDLYRNSGLKPWEAADNKKYFSSSDKPDGDGTHPNKDGHLLIAHKIKDFIINNLGANEKK